MASMKGDRLGLLPVRKDTWTDIVVHCKFAPENDGFFKLWIDGKVVFYKKGSSWVDCPNLKCPYFKAGIYAGAPQGSVLYFDEMRMAAEDGSYEAVCPGKRQTHATTISLKPVCRGKAFCTPVESLSDAMGRIFSPLKGENKTAFPVILMRHHHTKQNE